MLAIAVLTAGLLRAVMEKWAPARSTTRPSPCGPPAPAAFAAAGAGGPHGDGLVVLRADSAFYGHDVVAAARRAGARFSITARSRPAVSTAIASIRADAWTPIHYPNAVWDEAEQRLISDAEIAEVPFTAFTSRRTADHISGRLIVRRVKRLNPTAKTATSVAGGDRQGELFALYRYHAVFTDSPLPLVQAEKTHRAHAIIEQVHADLRSGPLICRRVRSLALPPDLAGPGPDPTPGGVGKVGGGPPGLPG